MNQAIRMLVVLMLLAVLLPACRPDSIAAAPADTVIPSPNSPTPTSEPAVTSTPTSVPPPALVLEPCRVQSINAECGTLLVYENHTAQRGRKIDLNVVVVRAKSVERAPDPLFYLIGGPGGAATEAVRAVMNMFSVVNLRRDIVLVDQRGTGKSNRLECPLPESADYDPQEYAQECLTSIDGDPRLYTTAHAMDDVEAVRQALGYDQINLYGISYGVTAAQVYLNRHGEHVRSVILDHGTLLDVPFLSVMPRNSQMALEKLFERCQKNAGCQSAFPDLENEFQSLLAQLDEGPVDTSLANPAGGGNIQIDGDGFNALVHRMLVETYAAVRLPRLVHLASQGSWQELGQAYVDFILNDPGTTARLLMFHEIFCYEDWAKGDPEEMRRLSPDGYYTETGVNRFAEMQATCQYVPDPGVDAHHGPAKPSEAAVLVMVADADPQNPLANMEGAKTVWMNSWVAIEPYQGHVPDNNSCRIGLMTQFIRDGSGDGLDMDCLEKVTLPAFDTRPAEE